VAAKGFELTIGIRVEPQELGAQLRRLRESLGVSAADLAERMDWKPTNVSRLERGGDKREPTISSVNLYVRMLGFELVLVSRPKRAPRRGVGDDAGGEG
jgi:transcriptional regulator with XRE-family HTH domain